MNHAHRTHELAALTLGLENLQYRHKILIDELDSAVTDLYGEDSAAEIGELATVIENLAKDLRVNAQRMFENEDLIGRLR